MATLIFAPSLRRIAEAYPTADIDVWIDGISINWSGAAVSKAAVDYTLQWTRLNTQRHPQGPSMPLRRRAQQRPMVYEVLQNFGGGFQRWSEAHREAAMDRRVIWTPSQRCKQAQGLATP